MIDKKERFLEEMRELFRRNPYKIVVSKPGKKTQENKKLNILLKSDYYQLERYTETQVFHENLSSEQVMERLCLELGDQFFQMNLWTETEEVQILVSRKGAYTVKKKSLKQGDSRPQARREHNRKKHYILEEGQVIPPLVDMGIFTREGKIVASMQDKFRQINRFVEIVDDVVRHLDKKHLSIIDFGCGKSYLTFILYYYFTEIRGIEVDMTGLDLKADVIKHCNEAAKRYGYSGMHFELGDVNGYRREEAADMVITLHACDTATDYALFHAMQWKTGMIFSVPCCQHELNQQFSPDQPSILGRYGIIKERSCALMTDAIRANLLSYCGYQTQLMEFVELENTPKNLLIRAIAPGYLNSQKEKMKPQTRSGRKEQYIQEVKELMEQFHFQPALYELMKKGGYLPVE